MFVQLNDIPKLSQRIHHHAILLTSQALSDDGLPIDWLRAFASSFCNVKTSTETWEEFERHADVFIADRERSILRLEEVAPIEQLSQYPPMTAKKRLFFIDRCDRLNAHATNSLLKRLEEPLVPSLFLLTAKRSQDVLPTIVSRCFRLQGSWKESQGIVNLEDEDKAKIEELLLLALQKKPLPRGLSTWEQPEFDAACKSQLSEVIQLSEKLAKSYKAENLQGCVAEVIANLWQTACQTPVSRAQLRFIKADLDEWIAARPFHPSSAHWLVRLLTKHIASSSN